MNGLTYCGNHNAKHIYVSNHYIVPLTLYNVIHQLYIVINVLHVNKAEGKSVYPLSV